MQTVFTNSMVAHVWAQQTQPYGKSGNGNFYFRDNMLFSYGEHFCVASFEQTRQGEVILVNCNNYSISTCKHQKEMWRAISYGRGKTVFHVDNPIGAPIVNLQDYEQRYIAALKSAARRRSLELRDHDLTSAETIRNEANLYGRLFCGKRSDTIKASNDIDAMLAGIEKRRKVERKALLAKRAIAEKALHENRLEQLTDWLNGDSFSRHSLNSLPCHLRINGENVETSHGARVPLRHAKRVFANIAKARQHGIEWRRSDNPESEWPRVGHFHIDSIDQHGNIKAGCHSIAWEQIEPIAQKLGLLDAIAA